MDEVMGRRYVRQLGYKLTGTLGVLLKAKEKGHVRSVKKLLNELKKKGTWMSPELVETVLKLAKEK